MTTLTTSDDNSISEIKELGKLLRIVLVSRFPQNIDQPRGGVETATIGLAKALIDFGAIDLHVVTLESDLQKTKKEFHDGITVHRLRRSRVPMFLDALNGPSAKRLNAYLTELSPSIVHYHETWGFSSSTNSLPSIFTVHGFDSLNLPTEKPRLWKLRSLVWRYAEKRGLRNQKHIVSIAPYVRREIEKHTSAQIYEIWNPLAASTFAVERDPKESQILFLGWLNSRKNPLAIIRAAAELKSEFPELKVELCGEASDPPYFETLKSVVAENKLETIVSMPGRQSHKQVIEKLSTATFLVLPSYQENAPMVVAEAMAVGVPVIASDKCGMPDMLNDGESGILIDPDKEPQLENAMRRLLRDKELRSSLAREGKVLARKRFHPESVAAKTVAAYLQVIDSSTH